MTIRPAVSEDAEGIARVFMESAAYHNGLDPDRYFVPAVETITARYRSGAQHRHHADTDGITLVAELDGQIAGFVDAWLDTPFDAMHRDMTYCHVGEIAVGTSFQTRGIGGRLLNAAEDWGRERGAAFALLEYLAANERAGRFYERGMGYRVAAITAVKRL